MKHRVLFCLLGCLTVTIACNKKTPVPSNNTPTTPAVTVDDIAGSYIGQNKYHKIDYAYSPGSGYTYYRDTVYTLPDTLTIQKISADSFELLQTKWKVTDFSMRFKLDTSNIYRLKNQHPLPSYEDTIRIQFFFPANDSIAIEKFSGTGGSSGYYRYKNDFSGKK